MAENDLKLAIGSEVQCGAEPCVITAHLSLTSFLVTNLRTGERTVASLQDLSAAAPRNGTTPPITDLGIIRLPDERWKEGERRAAVIRPLALKGEVALADADAAARQLGVSRRTVYTLIRRCRASGGLLTALLGTNSSGGRGKGRLPAAVEQILAATIREEYLSRQKPRAEQIVEEVRRRCKLADLTPPGSNTVRRRLRALPPLETTRRREGAQAAHKHKAAGGSFPEAAAPLDVVLMDHTPVDLIVVDEVHRRPIGRPALTVGIDVFSRCVTGFCLTLEAPSAVSVGLCLAHSVLDKDAYLTRLDVAGEWPIWGTPRRISVDNGPEFHSEALSRGCAQHSINIEYRPQGQPHYGGIIERLIGTLMQKVHGLPGTTFSHVAERGTYDAGGMAVLTLAELERWLTLVIVGQYHLMVHDTLKEPPIARFKAGLLGMASHPGPGPKQLVQNKKAFLVDFLPIERRTIQRTGFVLDHISYYSNALQPWIAERAKGQRFIIRRDPRDISRVFVKHPDHDAYLEVPYRTLNRPAVTLWEQRESVRQLRAAGRQLVDEAAIFRTIAAIRALTAEAAAQSRSARRRQTRHQYALQSVAREAPAAPRITDEMPSREQEPRPPARPFADIEEW